MFSGAAAMLLLLLICAACEVKACCWCDPDTPTDQLKTTGTDKKEYTLVFSDEFNSKDRNFANGKDSKWTALNIGDTSNKGTAFYLPEQATVQIDPNYTDVTALRIYTENSSHVGNSPTGEKGIFMPYKSAMLQTWNKFCFTGGILEYKARQPQGGGYWPALWSFGNLGRAVYQDSNTGLWPWSYDECDPDLKLPPTDPPQRISACHDHDYDKEGLLPFQGRGATELDVMEGAVTNTGTHSYAVGSLQLSPGVPPYFKPVLFGWPTPSGPNSWYVDLKFGANGKANNGWYGPPFGSDCPTGCPDALSGGLTEIDDFDTRYWTFRMEWRLGPKGGLAWIFDGEFVWSMDATSFGSYESCANTPDGKKACSRVPPRQIPNEPMSLVMNTAIGTWNGGQSALDGKHWPAAFYIDYARVWQAEENIGCDPPNYPTKKYIDLHADYYGEPVSPLGTETCPESYPPSAYKHAAELQERAELIRAAALTGVNVMAVRASLKDKAAPQAADGPKAEPTQDPATASVTHAAELFSLSQGTGRTSPIAASSTSPIASGTPYLMTLAGVAAGVLLGVGAALFVTRRKAGASGLPWGGAANEDLLAGEYHLAR